MNRSDWLIARQSGIGGSDIAAICGKHPYKTAIDVFNEKIGIATPTPDNLAMRIGRRFEKNISELVSEDTGIEWTAGEFARHAAYPFVIGTPDFVNDSLGIGLECKMIGRRQFRRWFADESHLVPDEYDLQCRWYLIVKNFERWKIAGVCGTEMVQAEITRNDAIEQALIEIAAKFMRDHVEAYKVPTLDASDSAREYLNAAYPESESEAIIDGATIENAAWLLAECYDRKKELSEIEEKFETARNQLCELIGESSGIKFGEYCVTWKSANPSAKTDWNKLAEEQKIPKNIIEQYTTWQPGSRRFLLKGLK